MRLSLSLHCMFYMTVQLYYGQTQQFIYIVPCLVHYPSNPKQSKDRSLQTFNYFREMTEPYLPEAVGEQGAISIFKNCYNIYMICHYRTPVCITFHKDMTYTWVHILVCFVHYPIKMKGILRLPSLYHMLQYIFYMEGVDPQLSHYFGEQSTIQRQYSTEGLPICFAIHIP